MAKGLMTVAGLDGQVELLSDRVVIHRQGLWNALKFGFNARREIPLSAITEVAFKPAGRFMFGEIEFVSSGRAVHHKKTANPSAVKFKRDKNEMFEALKEKIFQIVHPQNPQAK
ncbi:MAG: hypothetical protein KGI29_05740 [Pseudomonadota bacterium]|nr:hypothetical protein [Pseudomonadota bacterium]MDE3038361.1 hypothetical protein [Pseudomonadota bacterium]